MYFRPWSRDVTSDVSRETGNIGQSNSRKAILIIMYGTKRSERCIMTTDTAQSITDDGADAAEMTETVTAIGAIDGGAAVADPA